MLKGVLFMSVIMMALLLMACVALYIVTKVVTEYICMILFTPKRTKHGSQSNLIEKKNDSAQY